MQPLKDKCFTVHPFKGNVKKCDYFQDNIEQEVAKPDFLKLKGRENESACDSLQQGVGGVTLSNGSDLHSPEGEDTASLASQGSFQLSAKHSHHHLSATNSPIFAKKPLVPKLSSHSTHSAHSAGTKFIKNFVIQTKCVQFEVFLGFVKLP